MVGRDTGQQPSTGTQNVAGSTELNSAQRIAVEAAIGPIRVLAGPGSGKTRVLACRVAHLIGDQHQPAKSILAVTFTKKARKELHDRLQAAVGAERAKGITVGTFHSLCLSILSKHRRNLCLLAPDVPPDFKVYKDGDTALVTGILKEMRAEVQRGSPEMSDGENTLLDTRHVSLGIARLKALGVEPEGYEEWFRSTSAEALMGERSREWAAEASRRARFNLADTTLDTIARVYPEYQRRLRAEKGLDFGDMGMLAVRLLKNDLEVRTALGRKWRHILVDEWQDTDSQQYELIRILAEAGQEAAAAKGLSPSAAAPPCSLFVVGDPDQSVYGFRGAVGENLHRLEKDFDGLCTILLQQNYRSPSRIIDAATAVIQQAPNRPQQSMFSKKGLGEPVTIKCCNDPVHEGHWVACEAQRLLNLSSTGLLPREVAVLYRTNQQSRQLQRALIKKKMPFDVAGPEGFYGRREVKDCLSFLRLLQDPADVGALKRAIMVVAGRSVGPATSAALTKWCASCTAETGPDSVPGALPLECALALLSGPALAALSLALEGDRGWAGVSLERVRRLAGMAGCEELRPGQRDGLRRFAQLMADLRTAAAASTVYGLLKLVVTRTYMRRKLRKDELEGEERVENVEDLMRSAWTDVEEPADAGGLDRFLKEVADMSGEAEKGPARRRGSPATERKARDNAVQLMTVHGAKGLEFDVVFVTGVEDDKFPVDACDDEVHMNEERRLLYVAITRAKRLLYLSWRWRTRHWDGLPDVQDMSAPSPFLVDIQKYMHVDKPGQGLVLKGAQILISGPRGPTAPLPDEVELQRWFKDRRLQEQ